MALTSAKPTMAQDAFGATARAYIDNILLRTPVLRFGGRRLRNLDDIEYCVKLARRAMRNDGNRPRTSAWRDPGLTVGQIQKALRRHLRGKSARAHIPPPLVPVRAGIRVVSELLALSPIEKQVLQFLLTAHASPDLAYMLECFGDISHNTAAGLVAAASGIDRRDALAALSQRARLVSSGIVTIASSESGFTVKVRLQAGILELVQLPGLDREALLSHYLEATAPPGLRRADYAHLEPDADAVARILRSAVRGRLRGMNILFYGETGTGKTELAKVIAAELGLSSYVVGKADVNGESATALERLSSLALADRLLQGSQALLVFDELEDLFEWNRLSYGNPKMSKQWFNDRLESNAVPTIWITNRIEGLDPAFLRRFSYALEFRGLRRLQREAVLRRHLGASHRITDGEVNRIAQRYEVNAAQLGTAVSAARLMADDGLPDAPGLERVLAPVGKLVTGRDPRDVAVFDPTTYRLETLNASVNLAELAAHLSTWKRGDGPGVSLCLYGPPGTGKSEFVRYLAWRTDRRLLVRRVSDIVSPWVGMTEKNIAQAFREAEEEDAVLLFDEADSFLRDRTGAQRVWEVTEVNEFLQQLEAFKGIAACTTNLWRDIDRAALRRFVFKIEVGYLRPDQARVLFETVFRLSLAALPDGDEVSRKLIRVRNLTPGDFAAVARAVGARGPAAPNDLVDLLAAEVTARGVAATAIGFR